METRLILDVYSPKDPQPQFAAVVALLQEAGCTLSRADRVELPTGAVVTSLLERPEPVVQADGDSDGD